MDLAQIQLIKIKASTSAKTSGSYEMYY